MVKHKVTVLEPQLLKEFDENSNLNLEYIRFRLIIERCIRKLFFTDLIL